ncbi:MAG TPA: hypothetical protein PKI11_10135 [Candidatus Hydrogenedentes bacterium]|nr:hypothetical protein [Candidatus Hydrogenedentota bacterium]HNT87856.1 hypothetical protein [Candidatus Hydrogenedentota bacterium]
MTVQCCVCKKTKVNGEWRLAPPVRDARISHTYCPACLVESVALLAVERATLVAAKQHRVGAHA